MQTLNVLPCHSVGPLPSYLQNKVVISFSKEKKKQWADRFNDTLQELWLTDVVELKMWANLHKTNFSQTDWVDKPLDVRERRAFSVSVPSCKSWLPAFPRSCSHLTASHPSAACQLMTEIKLESPADQYQLQRVIWFQMQHVTFKRLLLQFEAASSACKK